MEEKNKKRLLEELKIAGFLFWGTAALVTTVHCWNMPEDAFITLCSVISLIGVIAIAIKECKRLSE